MIEDEGGHLTQAGTQFVTGLGIDLFDPTLQRRKRHCRACLDWTERRPHIGGAIGAALAERWIELADRARQGQPRRLGHARRKFGFRDALLGLVLDDDEKAVA